MGGEETEDDSGRQTLRRRRANIERMSVWGGREESEVNTEWER